MWMGIRSIRHRGLRRLYQNGDGRDLPAALVEKISDVLLAIDEAKRPDEVGLCPGWRLYPMKGELKGFWSVTVSGNWRVIFRFQEGDAFDLDFVDYH
jgi:proteic killer suppression protein